MPFTPHDQRHYVKVEELLWRLLGPDDRIGDHLSDHEIFLLLAAVWCHDVGMIPELFTENETCNARTKRLLSTVWYCPESDIEGILKADRKVFGSEAETVEWDRQVRNAHGARSARWVIKNAQLFGPLGDAIAVAKLCTLHRHAAYKHLATEAWEADNVHLQLLAAYLRLADCLHVSDIGGEEEFRTYLALGLDPVARFHWLKSRYAKDITVMSDFSVKVQIRRPPAPRQVKRRKTDLPTDDWNLKMRPLEEALTQTIQDEIDSVKDYLAQGGLSIFTRVVPELVEDNSMTQADVRQLRELLKLVELFHPALAQNASALLRIVLEQMSVFIENAEAHEAVKFLNDYRTHVWARILKHRPCHVLLWKVNEMLAGVLDAVGQNDEQRIAGVRQQLNDWKERRNAIEKAIPQHAFAILQDGDPVLLYGYSDSVLKCLANLSDGIKARTEIWVCEGRTKTEYRHNNRLTYSDGIRYALELRRIGCRNVHIVPDAAASNLFARKLAKKVLVGANGISPNGRVAHSLGHLAIVDMANQRGVPVYVVADTMKRGEFQEEPDLLRSNDWLTTDTAFEPELEQLGVTGTYNPREDIVESDQIEKVITERGLFKADNVSATESSLRLSMTV